MATKEHDVVVVGAGHNGLIVASYLAKAGVDVCVVERQDKVGGGAITREVTVPGFKHDLAAINHVLIQSNPLLTNDELGLLSKYGLKYVYPDPMFSMIFPDQTALVIYRDMEKTMKSIAQFSRKDAEAYPDFCEASARLLQAATLTMFAPPPPFGRFISFLEASEQGREYLRIMLLSIMDVLDEWFESDQLKLAIARYASEAMVDIIEKGLGLRAVAITTRHKREFGMAIPVGGSGMLSEALAACLKDHGGTIMLSSPVKRIKVQNGEAKGVVLESGEEILAKRAVISNLNVKQLFLDLMDAEVLPAGFLNKVRHIQRDPFSALHQALALNEAPKYKAGEDVGKAIFVEVTPFKEEFMLSFREFMTGIPVTRMPLLSAATVHDPTRAPKGKHTLYFYHYEPYHLKEGGAARWDKIKQEMADAVLEEARKYTTNLGPKNILGRWIASPLDLERMNPSFVEGSIHHIAQSLSQWMPNRPQPGWPHYRTPVKQLYMCGSSTHPGPAISGGGRAAVQLVMEDLGIDFKKVIAK